MFVISILFLLLLFVTICSSPQFAHSLYFGRNFDITISRDSPYFTAGNIAATEKGNVYVVWVDGNGVYFRSSQDNGTQFGAPVLISNISTTSNKSNILNIKQVADSSQTSPQIAATEKGNVYVVWVDGKGVYFRSSQDNGTEFGAPVLISNIKRLASDPQIAATEEGSVFVVWVDSKRLGADTDIMIRSSSDGGQNFGNDERISRKNDVLSFSPAIAATENEYVYVARADKEIASGDTDIIFRSSVDGGQEFNDNVYLNREPKDISISFSPQIAATERGNVFTTWSENRIQFKQILDNGTTFSQTISLNNDTMLESSPQIAATENGNIFLIWVDENSTDKSKVLLFKRISDSFFDRNP